MEAFVHAEITRQLRHTQRELRVRDDLGSVVHEAGRRKALAQWIVIPEPVAAMKLVKGNPFGRVLGVQVEGKPQDLGVELAP